MPWREAADLLHPIATALAFVHANNIIHRDVKPSNILFDKQNKPILSDFGIARFLEQEETVDLTGSGIIGTTFYMSPEQHMGQLVDHRSDIYSLGIVFYELITGRKPFDNPTTLGLLLQKTRKPLIAPRKYVRSIPIWIEDFLIICLAPEPNQRFQTTEEFVEILKKMSYGEKVVFPSSVPRSFPTSTLHPPRSNQWMPLVLILVVALAGFAWWAVRGGLLIGQSNPALHVSATMIDTSSAIIVTPTFELSVISPAVVSQPSSTITPVADLKGSRILPENLGQLQSLEVLPRYLGSIVEVNVSPSGEQVVFISEFDRINLWNLETDNHLIDLISPEVSGHGANTQVAFSSDGRYMAVLVDYSGVAVWRVKDGSLITNFKGPARILAFSPVGEFLAIGYYTDLNVDILDLSTCESNPGSCGISRGFVNAGSLVTNLSYSHDGKLLWVRTRSSLSIWRPLDGANLGKTSEIPYRDGDQFALSPNGDIFFLHNSLWSVDDYSRVKNLSDDLTSFATVAFTPDGTLLAAANGNTILLFDTQSGENLLEVSIQTESAILEIAFDQSGETLMGVAEDGTIQRWGIP